MRIALGIEYNGEHFFGWQKQHNLPTIQEHIENALAKILIAEVKLTVAGRTDKGVHATGQVAHFDTDVLRDMRALTMGTNTYLPETIRIKWALATTDQFHARFSAVARTYQYIIYNAQIPSAIFSPFTMWCPYPLDVSAMQQSAGYLLGEHDFSSFRSSQCDSLSPMRNLHFLSIARHGNFIIVDIRANAFLHHMVRNIIGVLISIGRGVRSSAWMGEVLLAKDRRMAAETAVANGLFLKQISYPASEQIPQETHEVFFF